MWMQWLQALITALKNFAAAVFCVDSHAKMLIEMVRLVGDFYCACIWQAELGVAAAAVVVARRRP
jgi:hypothetical protein